MKRDAQDYDQYYQAVKNRDPHFDGKFFFGVKTTGIYCRPICPAKPKLQNIEFFNTRQEAESAGYRACLRCRPETVPMSPAWRGKSAVVQRAIKKLEQKNIDLSEDQFAEIFGVSARHLRRLFTEEVGKTPKQIFFEKRLLRTRKLIEESQQSLAEVALASGFKSIRRFNDAFKDFFKISPRELRQKVKINMEKESMMNSAQWVMKTDFVTLYLVASEKGLQGVWWKKKDVPMAKNLTSPQPQIQILAKAVQQLEEYFSGKRQEFDLPFDRQGTPFQQKVWKELSKIPYGKTLSYSDIARKIKNEKAVRAVGSANGKNPLSIVIPCHRVIAADGSLGGFAGGLNLKTKLLALEKARKIRI